ncbi:hypothetical protein Tco_0866052, partial [Tanacetum coccineum]
MSGEVARGHGGDGGGDDRPPPYQIPTGCGGCLSNRGKGTRKPNLGGWKAGRLNTYKETRNLGLRKITDQFGPQAICGQIWMRDCLLGDPKTLRCAQNAETGQSARSYAAGIPVQIVVLRDRHLRHSRVPVPDPDLLWIAYVTVYSRETMCWLLYEEMLRLQGLGTYTDDQIMAIVRRGKQQGHIPSVGRVLAGRGRDVLVLLEPQRTHTTDVDELKRTNKQLKKQMDMIMKVVRSDDKMSQLLTQLPSQYDVGSGSRSGGGGDDESGDDEDAGEEEDEEDKDS